MESYDAIITRKWFYDHPKVYLCKKGDENWPIIGIRRFAKVAKMAIFRRFAKWLITQKCVKWPNFGSSWKVSKVDKFDS